MPIIGRFQISTYRVATGTNIALVSLAVIVPQPRSTGVRYTQRSYSASGGAYDTAPYVELEWTLLGNVAAYTALLTQFGVQSALTAAVTVYVKSSVFGWVRYNGIAVQPVAGVDVKWELGFPRNIVVLVRDLAVSS